MGERYYPLQSDVVFNIEKKSEKTSELEKLTKRHALNPNAFSTAFPLALHYIELADRDDNVRYYGRAEAIIKPWWDATENVTAQLLKAKILQFNHQFEQATQTLTQILSRTPRNAQARLMRANISLVEGRLQDSKKDCAILGLVESSLISATCMAAVDGLQTNNIFQLVDELLSVHAQSDWQHLSQYQWMIGIIAESLMVHGHYDKALSFLELKDSDISSDNYLMSLKADIYLQQHKYQRVIELLGSHYKSTPLLVRLLIAEKKLNSASFGKHNRLMQMRIDAERARRGSQHLREQGYYYLYVMNDLVSAKELAMRNWKKQKEIADLRLLYDSHNSGSEDNSLSSSGEEEMSSWTSKNRTSINPNDISYL